MGEQELRLHRCCFTGHRPEKISAPEATIKEALRGEVKKAITDGFVTFISGMARGVDVAGELVRSGLVFHYSLQGTLNHAHTFDEVLLAAYNRAASFGIPDEFRGEYSQQELQFIEALVDRGVRDRTSE